MSSDADVNYQGYPPPQASAGAEQPEYGLATKIGAAALTVIAPFIALIAALVLRSSEVSQVRRAILRTWAIVSGVWLAAGIAIVIIAVAAIASSGPQVSHSGPCRGGPIPGASGTPIGNGNYRFACANGGSTVMHLG